MQIEGLPFVMLQYYGIIVQRIQNYINFSSMHRDDERLQYQYLFQELDKEGAEAS